MDEIAAESARVSTAAHTDMRLEAVLRESRADEAELTRFIEMRRLTRRARPDGGRALGVVGPEVARR